MKKLFFTIAVGVASIAFIAPHIASGASADSNVFAVTGKFMSNDGESLYKQNCQSCHMPQGAGAKTGVAVYPALAKNSNVEMPGYTAGVILNGLRGMPSFDPDMTDEQVAAVSNFLAKSFGNKGTDTITADDAKALRPEKPVEYIDY